MALWKIVTHIVWIMQYELPNRENIRGWTVQPRSKTVWLGNAISVSRKTYRKNIRFHPYPNCTSTKVCKMGRKSNCVSCEIANKFFKIGWILDTKIVFFTDIAIFLQFRICDLLENPIALCCDLRSEKWIMLVAKLLFFRNRNTQFFAIYFTTLPQPSYQPKMHPTPDMHYFDEHFHVSKCIVSNIQVIFPNAF